MVCSIILAISSKGESFDGNRIHALSCCIDADLESMVGNYGRCLCAIPTVLFRFFEPFGLKRLEKYFSIKDFSST
jgi:hypothetical protein